MKKKSLFLGIAFLLMGICGCGGKENTTVVTSDDIPKENVVSADAEFITYEYEELKDRAAAIIKVEVLDELTSSNSMSEYSDVLQGVVSFCSMRKVKVLDVYKDNNSGLSVGDEIEIQDDSAIYEENGEYYQDTLDDTPALEKGSVYLIFLSDGDTMSGKPAIISCQNGRINLTNIEQNNEYYEIAVKSIVEYESDLSEEQKEQIIQTENIYPVSLEKADENTEISIDTSSKEINISMRLNIDEDQVGVYLESEE